MSSLFSFSILTLSILLAMLTSRKTLRLYFWAQFISTIALYYSAESHVYTFIYLAADLLMLELCCFLLLESKVDWFTIRTAATFGAVSTAIACFGLSSVASWIVLVEGGVFSALGMAMMLCGESIPILGIGTLTMAMSVYDFGWLASENWRSMNGWAPSTLCALTFLGIAVWNKCHGEQKQRAYNQG